MFNKAAWKPIVLMLMALMFTGVVGGGCYCFAPVEENEIGLQMNDGVSISAVHPPGRYGGNLGFFADFQTVDCQAKIIEWEDASLVTQDKQPIGLKVAITVRRDCADAGIRSMWQRYNIAAKDDEALAVLVRSRAPDAAKAVTTEFTLDEMLGIASGEGSGRALLVSTFRESLDAGLVGTSILIEAVNVNDIAPSLTYLDALEEKADAQVQTEVAKERTSQLVEQLKQEEKQTDIDLEKARRENLINAEMSKAFDESDRFYELERLRLLKDVVGDTDKMFFIPEGTDLTLLLGGESLVPIKE